MPIPRHRRDSNHDEIAQNLRQIGALVFDVHGYDGMLDLVVCRAGSTYFLEVKDGSKPASARRLTPAEQETIRLLASVGVTAHVVTDTESAMRAIGAIL
jgi:hypothetical protein